jgi:hypothetical protein
MTWHIQFRKNGDRITERFRTPEAAIAAACEHIDCGHVVTGIGTGDLTDSISEVEIAKIYAIWVRAKKSSF